MKYTCLILLILCIAFFIYFNISRYTLEEELNKTNCVEMLYTYQEDLKKCEEKLIDIKSQLDYYKLRKR